MTSTTKSVYKRCSHGKLAKIRFFKRLWCFSGLEIIPSCGFRHNTFHSRKIQGFVPLIIRVNFKMFPVSADLVLVIGLGGVCQIIPKFELCNGRFSIN